MKKQLVAILLIQFAGILSVIAEPGDLATGSYVLTMIGLDEHGKINPHLIETQSAYISNSDGEYTISIQYGRAGMIKLPLHISGDRISFFVTPDSGSVDGRDLIAKGFFGNRVIHHIAGWSTYGENREAFKLEPFKSLEPKSVANKAE